MISVQLADTAIILWFIPLMFCNCAAMWGYPALSLAHLVTSDIFWVTGPASDFNIRKKSRDLRMSSSQEHEASIMIMFPVTHDIVNATTLQNRLLTLQKFKTISSGAVFLPSGCWNIQGVKCRVSTKMLTLRARQDFADNWQYLSSLKISLQY